MRDDLASQTFPVILYGLRLRDRVAAGRRPGLAAEQAELKGLLGSADRPAPWGSGHDPDRPPGAGAGREFLGLRYALTCWLDEILIDAGWREWDENKLETALYRTNIRYRNFWQQARLAEASPAAADAQEVFLLCVLLGFRGEMAEAPERLREWVRGARARVARAAGREPAPLPEKAPVTDVPPLLAVEAYRRMTRRLVAGVLFAVPVAAFLAVLWSS